MRFIKKVCLLILRLNFGLLLAACGNEIQHTSLAQITSVTIISPAIQTLPITTVPVSTPTAVSPVKVIPTPTVTSTVDWQHRWLAGIPCYLPCWEGMRPGQTTANEAVTILKQIPFIKNVKVIDGRDGIVTGLVDWDWQSSNNSFGIGGEVQLIAKESVETVGQIVVFYEKSFTLGEVIKTYGNSTYVYASLGIGESTTDIYAYTTILYFVKNGFSLYLSSKPKYLIDQDTLFNAVIVNNYDPFNRDPLSLPQNKERTELLVPWQGYNNFDFYCRAGYGKDGKTIADCSEIYKYAS